MSTFRQSQSQPVEPEAKETKEVQVSHDDTTPPFTGYKDVKGKPYVAEYYQLGKTWDDPNGGFSEEISLIDTFFEDRIKKGELPNNVESVKEALRKMEKTVGVDKNERPLVKVEMISAYVKFLMEADKIKFDLARYERH